MIIPLEKFWSIFTERPCDTQRLIVEKEWPNGIPLTEETIKRALDLKLDILWIGTSLPEPLWREYQEKCAPLLREYQEKRALLWREYEEKRAPLWRDYEEKRAPLWRDYEEKTRLLLLEILTVAFK